MKRKTTHGLGDKNLSSFPKHDSLKYWRLRGNSHQYGNLSNMARCQQSYINTICESESLYLDNFPICSEAKVSPNKVHVQTK